jgi:tetratricopeptide (TPR) repeat protein
MHMTKKRWRIIGVVVAVAALASVYYLKINESVPPPSSAGTLDFTPAITPVASTTSEVAPTQDKTTNTAAPTTKPFPINTADTIVSWSFKGAYDGNETLIANANADIVLLTGLLGKGKYDNYDLYNGIANDYGFLGDGTQAYLYYNRAIHIHPQKGLAYMNLAHLMDQLGAYRTAADAYAKAVAVQPSIDQFRNAQLDFLMAHFGDEAAKLQAKQ